MRTKRPLNKEDWMYILLHVQNRQTAPLEGERKFVDGFQSVTETNSRHSNINYYDRLSL